MFFVYAITWKVYGSSTYTFGLWKSVLRELTNHFLNENKAWKVKKFQNHTKVFYLLPHHLNLFVAETSCQKMAKEENTPAKLETTLSLRLFRYFQNVEPELNFVNKLHKWIRTLHLYILQIYFRNFPVVFIQLKPFMTF